MNYNVDHIVQDSTVWVRDGSGAVQQNERRVRRKDLSATEIRVISAIANSKRVIDCRGLSLEDICFRTCVRHVNEIDWDSVPQIIAAKLFQEANKKGTLLDCTITRLLNSKVHHHFLQAARLPYYTLLSQTTLSNFKYLADILMLDLGNSVLQDAGITSLLPLVRLEWLNLTNTRISDEGVKMFTYPTKYRGKGCLRLKYLNVSVNRGITMYGFSLLSCFPDLRTLVTSHTTEVEVPMISTDWLNWGHDGVIRWLAEGSMQAPKDPQILRNKYILGNFYKPALNDRNYQDLSPQPCQMNLFTKSSFTTPDKRAFEPQPVPKVPIAPLSLFKPRILGAKPQAAPRPIEIFSTPVQILEANRATLSEPRSKEPLPVSKRRLSSNITPARTAKRKKIMCVQKIEKTSESPLVSAGPRQVPVPRKSLPDLSSDVQSESSSRRSEVNEEISRWLDAEASEPRNARSFPLGYALKPPVVSHPASSKNKQKAAPKQSLLKSASTQPKQAQLASSSPKLQPKFKLKRRSEPVQKKATEDKENTELYSSPRYRIFASHATKKELASYRAKIKEKGESDDDSRLTDEEWYRRYCERRDREEGRDVLNLNFGVPKQKEDGMSVSGLGVQEVMSELYRGSASSERKQNATGGWFSLLDKGKFFY